MTISRVFIIALLFLLTFLGEFRLLSFFRGRKMTQVIKAYGPQSHLLKKQGTPSMGGSLFPVIACLSLILFSLTSDLSFKEGIILWFLPSGCALIGLADDWLKYMRSSSEGLSSFEKFTAQLMLTIPWSICFFNYHGVAWWPGWTIGSPFLGVFLLVFVTVGVMNAVNVTDGLDGLASGCVILSLSSSLLMLQMSDGLRTVVISGLIMAIVFLWYNAHPALIFMGDVGSHFFAGVILVSALYSGYLLALIPLCFIFGLEILSVCVQLVAIHGFGKKVFLMSPFHHHFELKGWSESQIVHRFWIIHGVGIFSLMSLLHLVLS